MPIENTFRETDRSIIVERLFESGRSERWIFEGYDCVGTNGLPVDAKRPYNFPMFLWTQVQERRRKWPETHIMSDGLSWVHSDRGWRCVVTNFYNGD